MFFISVGLEHLLNGITHYINTHFKPYFDSKSKVSFKISSLQSMVAMHAVLFQRQLLGDTENLQRRCFKLTRHCCVRPDWEMTNSIFSFPVIACFGHEFVGYQICRESLGLYENPV